MLNAERKVRCVGKTYSGSTVIVEQESSAEYYGRKTAICDYCGFRYTLNGSSLPDHYLVVTVHGSGAY